MKHTTPLSRLAELVGVDYASMNQEKGQDATCEAAHDSITSALRQIERQAETICQMRAFLETRALPALELATRDYPLSPLAKMTVKDCRDLIKANHKEMPDNSITDTGRLDYLDSLNKEFNKRNNSNYGWEIDWNHNRIALHDIGPMGMSVRQAIDEHRERVMSHQKAKEAEHG